MQGQSANPQQRLGLLLPSFQLLSPTAGLIKKCERHGTVSDAWEVLQNGLEIAQLTDKERPRKHGGNPQMRYHRQPVILVTGSEGLIGDAIVNWEYPTYDIASFDIARPHKRPELQDFIDCDFTSDESVDGALRTLRERHGNKLASVVHLAAYYDFSGRPSPLYRKLTVEGTTRLLRGLQSFDVDQFVFSSTHIVMKPSENGEPLTEASPVGPEWDYPKSKLATANIIRDERGKIPAVILRIGGVYNEDGHTVPIAQHIARIYERRLESYFFPGDPSAGQAFVHLNDLVDLIHKVIENRHRLSPYEVLLVAEPDLISYDELQDIIGKEIHGEAWPTIRIPKLVAKAGAWMQERVYGDEHTFIKPWMIDHADDNYPVSSERARDLLGWEPKRRLRNTIPEMIRRLRKNPQRWYEINGVPVPQGLTAS
jgi:nucleoside-diphosphate-sugar epimerase